MENRQQIEEINQVEKNQFDRREYEFLNHQDDITDIISAKPPFLAKWGILVLLLILVIILSLSWLIKYSDVITANGSLTSIHAPKDVVSKSDGKLVRLFIKEGQNVHINDVLGYIESTAEHRQVQKLSEKIDSIENLLYENKENEIQALALLEFTNLGEIQPLFQEYSKAHNEFLSYINNGYYVRKKRRLSEDIFYLKKLQIILAEEKKILQKDISLSDSNLKANEILKNQNVISTLDYRNERSKHIIKELTLPAVSTSQINNAILQHEKEKEIDELQNRISQQKDLYTQALRTLESSITEWKKKYMLLAPVSGKVSFASFIQENQQIKNGEIVCYVNPENTDYYVEAKIPQQNFGKVKPMQFVLLKFPSYSYHEFGYVEGTITVINNSPIGNEYMVKISLPKGLKTNYNKNIQYKPGLSVEIEVITEKKRLIQRLLQDLI